MHQWLERKIAPGKARQFRLRNENFPRTFRGDTPELYPEDVTKALERFRPPSMWAQHRVLFAVFLAAALSFGVFFFNAVRKAPPSTLLERAVPKPNSARNARPGQAPVPAAAAPENDPQSVYIQSVEPKAQPSK